jgi:WD40 repeat protein
MSLEIKPEGNAAGGDFDYYGQRYAVYNKKIEIFSVIHEQSQKLFTIETDRCQVTSLAWSHPINGEFIAAALTSYLKIYKETSLNSWEAVFEDRDFEGRLTSVSWAPEHLGLFLLVSNTTGSVSIFSFKSENDWKRFDFKAHESPLVSASWMFDEKVMTIVTHSLTVKVWKFDISNVEMIFEIREKFNDAKSSPFNTLIAGCNSKEVVIFDALQGFQRVRAEADGGESLQWSTYGTILVVTSLVGMQVLRRMPSDHVWWKVVERVGENGKIELVSK